MNKTISNEIKRLKHKVLEYKSICELNIVGSLYKNTENLYHVNLKLKNFNTNVAKVYFTIANQIIVKEKKEELDDVTIGLYLEKHPKLKSKYEEYKGYQTIIDAIELVNEKNLEAYIMENEKWSAVLAMLDYGMIVDLKEAVDLTADEIYSVFEARLNHVFLSVENEEKVYGLGEGLEEMIDKWDEGQCLGMPFNDSPLLTAETGGMMKGEVLLLGGISGSGKSSFVRNVQIPKIIEEGESVLYMVNEQGIDKTNREILVWVANTIFSQDIKKYQVRNGKYDPNFKKMLKQCAKWMVEHSDRIKILPFSQYTKSNTIKSIRKYASLGFEYFILDTFKLASDGNTNNIVVEMTQDMVDYYDVIKPAGLNVSLTCTFQLNKASVKTRHLTMENIGQSKSIIDVAGLCIMFRRVLQDEYEDEKNELEIYKLEGKYHDRKVKVSLNKDKDYFILFIVKNREGSANSYQIIVEHDLSNNYYREIGICHVPIDF